MESARKRRKTYGNDHTKERILHRNRFVELHIETEVYGYFGKMEPALQKYLEISHLDALKDEKLTIEEYIKAIRQINKESLQGLQEELRRFPVK